MKPTFRYHAFLSHNRADKDWTRRLAGRLRESGLSVFFDEDSIKLGEDILIAIENGLKLSRHVLLVLTPEALTSQWVALEYSASLYRDPASAARSIIPILRKDCAMPLILARLKYLDARSEEFDRQVDHLLSGIDRVDVETAEALRADPSFGDDPTPALRRGRKLLSVGPPVSPLGKSLYIERNVDRLAQQVVEDGSICVVSGPRRSGKTSLLLRAAAFATSIGKRVAYVDFETFSGGGSPPQTYFALCRLLSTRLECPAPVAEQFLDNPGPSLSRYLEKLPSDTALFLDELDMLRTIGALEEFAMIVRGWYNEIGLRRRDRMPLLIGSLLPPWRFIQTEFGSDFNIGIHARLEGFEVSQAERLIRGVIPTLPATDVAQIHELVGGHPFVLQCAMRWLCDGNTTDSLWREALSPNGPCGTYLATFVRAQSETQRHEIAVNDLANVPDDLKDQLEMSGAIRMTSAGYQWLGALYKLAFLRPTSEVTN